FIFDPCQNKVMSFQMMLRTLASIFFASLIFPGILIGVGCGQSSDPVSDVDISMTDCKNQSVQILVGDGFLQALCGCTQPGELNQVIPTGKILTCHVPSSTSTVFFIFSGT